MESETRGRSTSTSPVLGNSLQGIQRRFSWNKSRDEEEPPRVARPMSDEPRPFQFDFPSQASLETHSDREDEVHLTAPRWGSDSESHPKRISQRYPESPQRSTLKAVSRNLRRVSLRVVNLAGVQLEDRPIRLEDEPDIPDQHRTQVQDTLQDLAHHDLRGRSLGIFGPTSSLRRLLRRFLLWE